MAVIEVFPSDLPPVRCKGHIWVRVGPCCVLASAQEERILCEKGRSKDLFFDSTAVRSSSLKDLNRSLFENEFLPAAFAPDVLEANGRSYEERLASCHMIASIEDPTPTVLGLLVLSTAPQEFIPGAVLQFLRIDGFDLADDVIDAVTAEGPLCAQLRELLGCIRSHNRTQVDVLSGPTHSSTSHYPLAAIEQLIYNAVLHRTYEGTSSPVRVYWYNDRIEIISPGGPYGSITGATFGEAGTTDYRNPNLASAMKTLGFVQNCGRGISIARTSMKENGNPPPEFIVDAYFVKCILRKRTSATSPREI